MKKRVSFLIIIFCLLVMVWPVAAQPGDPGGGGNPTIPISGIEILLALGGVLGIRKLFARERKK